MTKTRSEVLAADVADLIRARNPLLWIVTREEARVEGYLIEAAAAAGYVPRTWDVAQGVASLGGALEPSIGSRDPGDMLDAIRDRTKRSERGVWILRDLPPWLAGPAGVTILRQIRNLARLLPGIPRESAQALVVLTPSGDVPAELASHATVVQWPLPDRSVIAAILDATMTVLRG